ncbi:MAG TPA: hypothetical protein VN969_00065 [Streptosporangiaceae bacterium]|nr:hypothetical protein [Streptosporangiaceae bacterium]
MADATELGEGFLGRVCEVAFGDGGCLVAAQPAEYLDAVLGIGVPPGGVGQDNAAWVVGVESGVGEGHVTAEAAAEHYWPDQPERVTQPPQVIGPGPQVPGLGVAVVAAPVPALIVVKDLEVLGERCQLCL